MSRYLLLATAMVLLLIVAGWFAVSVWMSKQQEDVFGVVYAPFAQHSPEELEQALRSVPPPKPGPLLSVEVAQQHISFPLVLMQCSDLAHLEGIRLTKEIFPDGSVGLIFTQVIYRFEEKEITLTEMPESNNQVVRPDDAQQVIINGNTGFLVKDWVPGKTEVWWALNNLHLRLSADKAVSPDMLTKIAECVHY
jgi:hypothetical protein